MPSKRGLFHRAIQYIKLTPIRRTRRKVRELKVQQQSNEFLKNFSASALRQDRRRTLMQKKYQRNLYERDDAQIHHYVSGLFDASAGRRAEAIRYVAKNLLLTTQPVVVQLLKDESPIVRSRAIVALTGFEALAQHGLYAEFKKDHFEDAAANIRKRLIDKDPRVRKAAVICLGMLEDKLSIDRIRDMVRDDNKSVRQFSRAFLTFHSERNLKDKELSKEIAKQQILHGYRVLVEKVTGQKPDPL